MDNQGQDQNQGAPGTSVPGAQGQVPTSESFPTSPTSGPTAPEPSMPEPEPTPTAPEPSTPEPAVPTSESNLGNDQSPNPPAGGSSGEPVSSGGTGASGM